MRQTLLIGVFACAVFGQAAGDLRFEVASVRPEGIPPPPSRRNGGPGTSDPGQITWSSETLKGMLMTAYNVKGYQFSGPAWLDSESDRYHIVAKVPPGATKQQVNVMWQNLLAERFGVVVHHEPKEFQVEELMVAKGGPKLKESVKDDPNSVAAPPSAEVKLDKNRLPELYVPGIRIFTVPPVSGDKLDSIGYIVGKVQPLSQLANAVGGMLGGRPVIDKTGLTGNYDFRVEFTPDSDFLKLETNQGWTMATAVQLQDLGLRLVPGKATLDVVVADHINKVPTDN